MARRTTGVFVLLVLGVLSIGAALLLVWWAKRRLRRPTWRWIIGGFGALLLFTGVIATAVHMWATSATDTSQFARALLWGESAFGDQDRFPVSLMRASTSPVTFRPVADSPAGDYVPGTSGASLEVFLESADTTAFVVIHGDDLLYEGYFNGSSHDAIQTSFSVAKSFISTLVGIAIEEEYLADLDDPVTDYIPELAGRDERYADISLRHLVTMSSGLSFDEGGGPRDDPANTYHGTNLRSAVVTGPTIERSPGEVFHYNDWNVILLGLVLERAAGMPVSEFMETRLWQPMGAEADGSWSLDSEHDGFEKMFVGVNGRAIDFAKLGWLYLHQGRNGDRQVVPATFVADATSLDTTTDPAREYQYLWWIDEERASYFANGDHGQFIYVDPGTDLVIVRHGRSLGGVDWIQFMGELAAWLEPRLSSG